MKKPAILFLGITMGLAAIAMMPSKFTDSVKPDSPIGLTIRGDTVSLSPRSSREKIYLILSNGYSCKECFRSLSAALQSYAGDDSLARYAVVIRSKRSIYARRLALNAVQELLPDVEEFYFDCADSASEDPWPPVNVKGGIFGRYNVGKTPALLVVGLELKEDARFLSYEELFAGDSVNERVSQEDFVVDVLRRTLNSADSRDSHP